MSKSFEQCIFTQANLSQFLSDKNKKVFYLVVINETIIGEPAVFSHCINHAKLSAQSLVISDSNFKVGNFSVLPLPTFDYLIASGLLEKFAHTCEENAQSLHKTGNVGNDFINTCKSLNNMFDLAISIDHSFWEREESSQINNLSYG